VLFLILRWLPFQDPKVSWLSLFCSLLIGLSTSVHWPSPSYVHLIFFARGLPIYLMMQAAISAKVFVQLHKANVFQSQEQNNLYLPRYFSAHNLEI
jgi:hypothetical protein